MGGPTHRVVAGARAPGIAARAFAVADPGPTPPRRSRGWLLPAVSLALPAQATAEALTGHQGHALALAAASTGVFLVLAARARALNTMLARALAREKDALDRQRVLQALGTALVGRPTRALICSETVDHARRLAGPGGEAVLLLDDAFTTLAHPASDPAAASRAVTAALGGEFHAGRPVTIEPAAGGALLALLPPVMAGRSLFVAPVVTGGRAAGAVVLAPSGPTGHPDRLLAACGTLGTTVSKALEASEVTERLVEERSEERFSAMIRNSSDILLVLGPDRTVRYLSPSTTRVLGWEAAHLLHRSIGDLVHPDDAAVVTAALHRALREPGTHGPVDCRVRHRDGSWRFLEAFGTRMLDESGPGIVVNIRDVTDRVLLQDQLTHQAFHDPLTGLANRALFVDRVSHALAGAGRSAREIEILILDLDDFKTVNDSLGHPDGDAVLVSVAERLRSCLRPSDTVARLGGDEFAILVGGGEESGAVIGERIVTMLRRTIVVGDREVAITGSIGVAGADFGDAAADLLRNADLAMYVAKSDGKDRAVVFRPEMLDTFLGQLRLEQALRNAVRNDRLEVHYQPIIDLATGAITGAEALLRWVDPVRGLVSPAEFIPVAERSELIQIMGRSVLHKACMAAATWQREGRGISHIAVNVSARQLRGETLVGDVTAALRDSGLEPNTLVIEITESMLLDQMDEAIERLQALHRLGVRIAIDDFGTGFSSLSRLGELPIDVLKVDQSFTKGLDRNDERSLVPAILDLARTLGLCAIAEGVETREQGLRLNALGCDMAQGFYFARPMTRAALTEVLATPPAAVREWAARIPAQAEADRVGARR